MVTNDVTSDDDWFVTCSNRQVHIMNPDPELIDIFDIAGALSKLCRFGGHCHSFYSVAQHSTWVCSYAPKGYEFMALMHDATEAYLGDVIRPLKKQLPEYRDIEAKWWQAIRRKFGEDKLPEVLPDIIKQVDRIALMVERRWLMPGLERRWVEDEHLTENDRRIIARARRIIPHDPEDACDEFLGWFHDLIPSATIKG